MTTKSTILRDGLVGMVQTNASHRNQNSWFVQKNLRITRGGFLQVPRKRVLATLGNSGLSCPLPP